MTLSRTLLALAATLHAAACTEGSEPAPSFAPVTCELASCVADVDAPIAVAVDGLLWLSVSATPGDSFDVRASDPDRLSVTVVGNAVDVQALAPGPVELELVDAGGDVVDLVELSVIAPDRLVADLRWVDEGVQEQRSTVAAGSTVTVPVNAAVGITITPRLGAFDLAGLIDYEVDAALPDGATLDTSGISETILLARAGEHVLTYRTGGLAQEFVLATP